MTEIQRWKPANDQHWNGGIKKIKMVIAPTGKYVKYSDYLIIESQVQALQKELTKHGYIFNKG